MKIYKPNLSNINPLAILGQGCTVHSQVWISEGVIIGNRVRIQAFVYIPKGVTIEDDVFIGPGVIFLNDKYPPSDNWLPILVKKGASIGGGTVILPGITIGEGALIGAGSVVTHDVEPNSIVYGNPARKKE